MQRAGTVEAVGAALRGAALRRAPAGGSSAKPCSPSVPFLARLPQRIVQMHHLDKGIFFQGRICGATYWPVIIGMSRPKKRVTPLMSAAAVTKLCAVRDRASRELLRNSGWGRCSPERFTGKHDPGHGQKLCSEGRRGSRRNQPWNSGLRDNCLSVGLGYLLSWTVSVIRSRTVCRRVSVICQREGARRFF